MLSSGGGGGGDGNDWDVVTFLGPVLSVNGSVLQHDGQIWSGTATQALGGGPASAMVTPHSASSPKRNATVPFPPSPAPPG